MPAFDVFVDGLEAVLPGQCILATSARAFVWSNVTAAADIWLDRLRIVHVGSAELDQLVTFAPSSADSRLWLTRTSLLGGQLSRGFGLEGVRAFAQGAHRLLLAALPCSAYA